jgi:hypothetical protein
VISDIASLLAFLSLVVVTSRPNRLLIFPRFD